MIQTLPKPITFEEFLEWKPDGGRYELHDGMIVEMQPVGEHEEINAFLARKLNVEFERLALPYLIPKQALVKVADRESGYSPTVLVVNQKNLSSEPCGKSPQLSLRQHPSHLLLRSSALIGTTITDTSLLTTKLWAFLNTGLLTTWL